MNILRFGPSGNSQIFYDDGNKHSFQAPSWLKQKGLNAYEYSFGRGFTLKDDTAKLIGDEAIKNDVMVSAHAPYYINLANPSDEMIQKSIGYITKGLQILKLLKGEHYVVHLASCGKLTREQALKLTKVNLEKALEVVYSLGLNSGVFICPETMGKPQQIGTYTEVVDFCKIDNILVPTFDFGHINALTNGQLKTYEDYKKIFDYALENLGDKARSCHIHFSKIEYANKGEIRHLNYDDNVYGPDFEPLAKLIDDYKLTPTIICESKDYMAEDAIKLKQIYQSILKK